MPLGAVDARLLDALRHQLDVREVYREPELKVADLARRLGTAEHKLSRLIIGPWARRISTRCSTAAASPTPAGALPSRTLAPASRRSAASAGLRRWVR
ncbi:hypothetical protein H1235_08335 [Pseudoxanthomonas sp. NC8]|nr:hypothetical protein H1235_08335 [Pseudoxanthomonas sp. NC8]